MNGCACFWKFIEKIIVFTLVSVFYTIVNILAEIFIILYILVFGWGLLLYNKDRDKDCLCAPHYYVLYCWNSECELLGKILEIQINIFCLDKYNYYFCKKENNSKLDS